MTTNDQRADAIEYDTVLIPCREYDPPSLRCWPCAQGRPEECQDPIVKRVPRKVTR